MNRHLLIFHLISVIILSGGCTLIPQYTRPQSPVSGAWPQGPAYGKIDADANAPQATEIRWQEFFTDEHLQKVIEIALQNNRDLRIAALNVERARGIYGIQRAELLPTIDVFADGTRQHLPKEVSGTGKSETFDQYSVNLGMLAWEIDFFGRIRSLKERALREFFASEYARRSAQISLIAEVANAYLTLAADRESLDLARYTLETQQEAYDLIKRRYENGLAQELDLMQVQTRVDAAKVDVSIYTRLVAQDESALNLLAGADVPDELLPEALSLVSQPVEISAGLSSEVLLRRPDILEAENLLIAANADIGAARAALFPRITLTTSVGTASSSLSGLFSSGTDTWLFSPQIVMPIFDPRAWSALGVTKTQRKIAVAKYERAIQSAFKEVADALAVKGTIEEQIIAQQSLVEAAAESYRLSNIRYLKGIDSYLAVIDAQRSLYIAQQRLVNFQQQKLVNQVVLYAAIGGGGDISADANDSAAYE